MILGVALAVAALFWLSTRPSLSTKVRMMLTNNTESLRKASAEQPRFVLNLPGTPSTENRQGRTDIVTGQSSVPDFEVRQQTKNRESNKKQDTNKQRDMRFHTVRNDETLSAISYKYYGDESKWQKIFDANRETIKDANKLREGTKLFIPE